MLKNKKILIVLGTLEMGGAERQALYLAEYLVQKENAIVEVWGLSREGLAAQKCEELGVKWRILPFRWPCRKITFLKTFLPFLCQLRKSKPHIVLAYTSWANIACGLSWKYSSAKICIWNQRDVFKDNFIGSWIEKKAIQNMTTFISNSKTSANFLNEKLNIPLHKITIIHNGIDIPPVNKNKDGHEQLNACMIGTLRTPKDHLTLIQAWEKVIQTTRSQIPPPKLFLAGRFQDTHQSVVTEIDRLKMNDHIELLGEVNDVYALLSKIDLGLFCSNFESFPNGLLECMAAGLPVVATDIPAVKEVVGKDNYKYLAKSKNSNQTASLILRFLLDENLRNDIGKRNRQRIVANFPISTMCRETIEIINKKLQ